MASGIVTILIIAVVAVAAFFLYRKYQKDKANKQLQQFANPVPEVAPDANFLSPITQKAING